MQSPFEPLLLNLRGTSYNSNSNLADKPKSPTQSPKNKHTKRARPQTHHSLAPRRERPQTRQARPITTIQRIAHLNKTFSNYHGTSFLQFSLKNPDENGQEKNLQELENRLHASKAPRNDIVTLQDLALKRRISNQQQENFNRTSNQVNQNQSLDERMILHFQKVDKEIMNRSIDGTSFMEYSPIKRTEGSESPNRTIANESQSIWDAMGKLEKRARATDQQMRIEDGRDSKMNDTFDLSRDGKAVDLSLTQDDKVFRRIGLSTSKRGKEDLTPSAGMSNTFQSSKIDSTNRMAFGRKGKNLNRSVDKGMEKLRLDTLNDSVTVTNDKMSTKKKDEPRKYDGYKQVATEEERERMSKFLKDEYVNEMLMNKYHVDMDKFQIRDAINDIHKKANQDKLLRQKFRDFLKNGIIEVPTSKQAERKRGTVKKTSYLDVVQLKRKKSETFTSDLSDDLINVVDTSFDITSKEGKRSRETSFDTQKNRNRLGDALLLNPFDFKRKNMSPQASHGMKSARSDDDNSSKEEDSRDEQQRREMNRIRLMETKKTLNNKFNKGPRSREEIDDVMGGNTLAIGNRNISEQEQAHAFIKAAKSGDYKTVKKLLLGKPSLVSACDLLKQSALHWAAREGHFEICQILVEYGTNVNMTDVGDKTALYYALKGKYTAIVQLLLSCKTGALAVKTTTFGTLGEGVEILKILKEVQPAIPGSPVKKEAPQRARNYSIRVTQARRESKMAIKLIGLTKIPENV